MPPKTSVQVGDRFTTNEGYDVEVIQYNNAKDVIIRFTDNSRYERSVPVYMLRTGEIKNPYHPSVVGVGYLGVGSHKSSVNKNHTKSYLCWGSMLKRCYCYKYKEKYPSYNGCSVCEDWHNFQNFAAWYEQQPNSEKEGFDLDKDLTVPGNKIYSPETCNFVPKEINYVINSQVNRRGDWPIGVSNYRSRYVAYININKKRKHLGVYDTPEEAFAVYKRSKNEYLKELAVRYKDMLPYKVYKNLMNWEIV